MCACVSPLYHHHQARETQRSWGLEFLANSQEEQGYQLEAMVQQAFCWFESAHAPTARNKGRLTL